MCSGRTFKQLDTESCKPALVSDDNLADVTAFDLLQKGLQTTLLAVEARCNFADDVRAAFSLRCFLESLDLALETSRFRLVATLHAVLEGKGINVVISLK